MPRKIRTNRSVAQELPELAAAHGMSIRAVARSARVNQSHLSRILSGEIPASGQLAARLAEIYDLPADYFPEYRSWRLMESLQADSELRDRLYDRYARS